MLAFDLVAHRTVGDDVVAIAASFTVPCETSGCFEVLHDALNCPLGDAHLVGEIAEPELRVTRKADEHVAVVGEKGPASRFGGQDRWCSADIGSKSHLMMLGRKLPELNFR